CCGGYGNDNFAGALQEQFMNISLPVASTRGREPDQYSLRVRWDGIFRTSSAIGSSDAPAQFLVGCPCWKSAHETVRALSTDPRGTSGEARTRNFVSIAIWRAVR